MDAIAVNAENLWRLETPEPNNWERSPRPDAGAKKYFMISADTHLNPPPPTFVQRVAAKFRERLPRFVVDDDGQRWYVTEGQRKHRVVDAKLSDEDDVRQKSGVIASEADVQARLAHHALDGIDGEVIFPGGIGLSAFATPDAAFSGAMCRAYNDWAWETVGPHARILNVAANIATGDVDAAVAEAKRVINMGFRVLTLPCKPVYGAFDSDDNNYNLPVYDPLWAVCEEAGVPVTFHVSTGRDPRTARGHGGAVINYVAHSLAPTLEPLSCLCSSGVFDRFPKLKFATIEAGIGWIPWVLDAMDEVYKKHHFWVRPKLKYLPSEYFRMNGGATFGEDPAGLALMERYNLQDNFMWANDYPHQEGTWPHSAAAIERTMGGISETSRAKILGLNAARMFGFEVPN
jgi:predicted TIM-barrel fold metal-dependent hydrolase